MNTNPGKHSARAQGRLEQGSSKFPTVLVIALVVLAAVVTYFLQRAKSPKAIAAPPATNATAGATSTGLDAKSNFQIVKGRWARPDGDYVLEIRAVEADGQLDARYYNPQPIHVSKAEVKKDGGATKVFVELTDVNYPGCKYNLTYIPTEDKLAGTYFQAALQETYAVMFERLKE